MSDFLLSTAVAFFIFNRPQTTERVFAEIARARPPKLLVISDGARFNIDGEAEKVAAAREVINQVDWPCEVLTNFSDMNLGCKLRVSGGLDWVFEQLEEAIILEDDCLPHPTFFRFCEELLERYRHDQRVGMISGNNFNFGRRMNDDSYYFSNISHIWGWATWRNRWKNNYDVTMEHWPKIRDEGRVWDWVNTKAELEFLIENFEKTHQDRIDTWDHQWSFCNLINGRISAMPNVNLVSNIGFGLDATHTKIEDGYSNIPANEILFPLKHPTAIFASRTLDQSFNSRNIRPTLIQRVKSKIEKIINR